MLALANQMLALVRRDCHLFCAWLFCLPGLHLSGCLDFQRGPGWIFSSHVRARPTMVSENLNDRFKGAKSFILSKLARCRDPKAAYVGGMACGRHTG